MCLVHRSTPSCVPQSSPNLCPVLPGVWNDTPITWMRRRRLTAQLPQLVSGDPLATQLLSLLLLPDPSTGTPCVSRACARAFLSHRPSWDAETPSSHPVQYGGHTCPLNYRIAGGVTEDLNLDPVVIRFNMNSHLRWGLLQLSVRSSRDTTPCSSRTLSLGPAGSAARSFLLSSDLLWVWPGQLSPGTSCLLAHPVTCWWLPILSSRWRAPVAESRTGSLRWSKPSPRRAHLLACEVSLGAPASSRGLGGTGAQGGVLRPRAAHM